MTIATRLDHYLSNNHIDFETVTHNHSHSSLHSAMAANILPVSLAKGVILEDHEGRHLMAVLPANANINMPTLNRALLASFHLVREHDIYKMFEDCENGAVPPVGHIYHLPVVYDKSLAELEFVYLEAGDHETLIKLDREAFIKLMGHHSRCLGFSRQVFH
ncbi:aminoacyl-tRNA deacylase [Vibrio quintilis]|uniref:YbaK / prolyl-tRNA synthetases associated domain protein n=1 Tax=Vibrio quintilis TaxID=1117707 RepID=A0A1M7YWB0_9VIBR|nr:YbaK/EbsC family protein [Vibrio quintilis]SHO56969.1 YbaK / prolyl-tRNA synthetases associated domain protein [Vibrio quintilis]